MSYKQDETNALITKFNKASQLVDGVECWSARDIQGLLGYTEYRNLSKSIDKAKVAAENSGEAVSEHFVDVNKMAKLGGSGGIL